MQLISDILDPKSSEVTLESGATLLDVFSIFAQNAELQFIPILDGGRRPVGAIHECDIRQLMLSPFAFSLAQNKGAGLRLSSFVRPMPVLPADSVTAAAIEAFGHEGLEGLLVENGGEYLGFVTGRRLLCAAGQRERRRSEQVGLAAAAFKQEAADLVRDLKVMAQDLAESSADARERASLTGEHATQVAAAAKQVQANVRSIAEQFQRMAGSLAGLASETVETRSAAVSAADLAALNMQKGSQLQATASAITEIVDRIESVARQVTTLALNAAIEAAHAGDIGRGFGVVAREVQLLAGQTRDASSSIRIHARSILESCQDVTMAQAEIAAAISRMERLAHEVDVTVAGERDTSSHASEAAAQAVLANDEIFARIQGIGSNAQTARLASSVTEERAKSLLACSAVLEQRVAAFVSEMQAI